MPIFITQTRGTRFDGPDIEADTWDQAVRLAGKHYEVIGERVAEYDVWGDLKSKKTKPSVLARLWALLAKQQHPESDPPQTPEDRL